MLGPRERATLINNKNEKVIFQAKARYRYYAAPAIPIAFLLAD